MKMFNKIKISSLLWLSFALGFLVAQCDLHGMQNNDLFTQGSLESLIVLGPMDTQFFGQISSVLSAQSRLNPFALPEQQFRQIIHQTLSNQVLQQHITNHANHNVNTPKRKLPPLPQGWQIQHRNNNNDEFVSGPCRSIVLYTIIAVYMLVAKDTCAANAGAKTFFSNQQNCRTYVNFLRNEVNDIRNQIFNNTFDDNYWNQVATALCTICAAAQPIPAQVFAAFNVNDEEREVHDIQTAFNSYRRKISWLIHSILPSGVLTVLILLAMSEGFAIDNHNQDLWLKHLKMYAGCTASWLLLVKGVYPLLSKLGSKIVRCFKH